MTFDTNVPNTSQSPGLFPSQNSTNFTRLKAMIIADHVFNDTSATNDGYHKIIHWSTQSGIYGDGTPAPVANTGLSYTKEVSRILNNVAGNVFLPFYKDPSGVEFFNAPGINAFVNFDGTGAVGAKFIREAVNVTSVTKLGTGLYRLTFGAAFPTNNYCPIITGGSATVGVTVTGMVTPGVYNTVVTTTTLDITFFQTNSGSPTTVDVSVGSVIIVGY